LPYGQIKHAIVVHFDNVHLERENPNVPSDIEQTLIGAEAAATVSPSLHERRRPIPK